MTANRSTLRLRLLRAAIGFVAVAGAAAAGWHGAEQSSPALFAGLLQYAIGVVGVAWLSALSVHNRLAETTEMEGLDHRQHRRLEAEVDSRMGRFWRRALLLALVGLCLAAPSIVVGAGMPVPAWLFSAACAALAVALLTLRRLWHELEEIRALKSQLREQQRREAERAQLVKALNDGVRRGWEPDEQLAGFRSAAQQQTPH